MASLPYLTNADLEHPGRMAQAISALEEMFLAAANGAITTPTRTLVITDDGRPQRQLLAGVASWNARNVATVKMTTLTPANPERGRALIQGLVVVMDLDTGQPVALIDGGALTGLRTGAVAGLAARWLAKSEVDTLSVIGAGVQARWALLALLQTTHFRTLRLASRGTSRLHALADWVRPKLTPDQQLQVCWGAAEACAGADIICTATSTDSPNCLVSDHWLGAAPLCIALGGAHEDACEFDPLTASAAQVIVEEPSAALAEAGEIRTAAAAVRLAPAELLPIAAILAGAEAPNFTKRRLFRSVGLAAEDLAAAIAVTSFVV